MRAVLTPALVAAMTVIGAVLGAVGLAAPAVAGVNDFSFSSFDADYTLARDAGGRSVLHTVETLTAEFPQTDQNHGIQRALVAEYRGAPTDLSVLDVTDGRGVPLRWEEERKDEFLLVTIASDRFVHGSATYMLTYEQRNVTLTPGDGKADEFYWDVNGTGWAQPFARVTGRLHLSGRLASALTGDAACYTGAAGSTKRCPITSARSGSETVLTASDGDLGPGQNVTLAVGFRPGTFVPRDDSLFASPLGVLLLVAVAMLLAGIAGAVVFRLSRLRDAPGRPTIVAEYLPPAAPDLLVSAVLLRRTRRAVAATFVALAVRRALRIVEEPTSRGKPAYVLEFVTAEPPARLGSGPRGVSAGEQELLAALFGRPRPGERVSLDPKDTRLSRAVYAVTRRMRKEAVRQGYQRMPPRRPRAILAILAAIGMAGTAACAFVLLASALGGVVPVLALILVPFGALAFVLPSKRPLTPDGAEVRDYLLGVRDYLRLAEADRMRMLQSPEGAQRVGAEGGSALHLYEQLLPHAVLFGVERDWSRVLGTWYEREGGQPDWYVGTTAFNAAAFSSGISSLSSSAVASYSGSSASSSTGGASGGGASGGGGGGGGGGGV